MSNEETGKPLSREEALERRCADLEQRLEKVERAMIVLSSGVEDRAMGVIETLAALIGKNIAAGRQRLADQRVSYKFIAVSESEPANEQTYRLTHTAESAILEFKIDGKYKIVERADNLTWFAKKFLLDNGYAIGAIVEANLYKLKPEAPAQAGVS
jgi:hypothetical protein